MLTYYLLIVALGFFQTVNNWLFWPAIIILFGSFHQENAKKVYLLAFVGGLLTDFLTGRTLGTSALFLLGLAAVSYLYQTKFKLNWQIFLIILLASQILAKAL